MSKTRIILDTDIGDDIDDALALALILRSPELDLCGITTVFCDTVARSRQARTILKIEDRTDIPVAAGCGSILSPRASRDGAQRKLHQGRPFLTPAYNLLEKIAPAQDVTALPEAQLPPPSPLHGVDFLIDAYSRKSNVTLVTIGALTNVAMAIVKAPHIVPNIPHIVTMGGVFTQQFSEWNISCDPVAASIVADSGIPMRWVGLDVTLQCRLSTDQIERFGTSSDELCRNLHAAARAWNHVVTLHDPLAVETILRPGIVTTRRGTVGVELAGEKTWGYTLFKEDPDGPHEVCTAVKAAEAVSLYLERVLR